MVMEGMVAWWGGGGGERLGRYGLGPEWMPNRLRMVTLCVTFCERIGAMANPGPVRWTMSSRVSDCVRSRSRAGTGGRTHRETGAGACW